MFLEIKFDNFLVIIASKAFGIIDNLDIGGIGILYRGSNNYKMI
jgi:hypothetical protein